MNFIVNYISLDKLRNLNKNIFNSSNEYDTMRDLFNEFILVKQGENFVDLLPCNYNLQHCTTTSKYCEEINYLARCYVVEYSEIIRLIDYEEFKKRYTI